MSEVRDIDWLFSRCVPEPNLGCWLWMGAATPRGYGYAVFNGKGTTVNRIAYMLANGPIPSGEYVCHKCDVPLCCNPQHLFAGTQAENLRDMRAKGRARDPRGEDHPRAKLSNADAAEMRRLVAEGAKKKDVAARFGVAACTVSNLCAGRYRNHKERS